MEVPYPSSGPVGIIQVMDDSTMIFHGDPSSLQPFTADSGAQCTSYGGRNRPQTKMTEGCKVTMFGS